MDALPSGSYLSLNDGTTVIGGVQMEQATQDYNESGALPYVQRTPEEIASFFDGLELVEPGVVSCPLWRPEASEGSPPAEVDAFGGGGRKPLPPLRIRPLAGTPGPPGGPTRPPPPAHSAAGAQVGRADPGLAAQLPGDQAHLRQAGQVVAVVAGHGELAGAGALRGGADHRGRVRPGAGPVQAGHDDRDGAVALLAAVEQAKGFGDPARGLVLGQGDRALVEPGAGGGGRVPPAPHPPPPHTLPPPPHPPP